MDVEARTITFNAELTENTNATIAVGCLDLGWTQTQEVPGGDGEGDGEDTKPIEPGEGDSGVEMNLSARAGGTMLEHGKEYTFWFRISSDVEVARVTLGGEAVEFELNPKYDDAENNKTGYSFKAVYNAFKGISILIYPTGSVTVDPVEDALKEIDSYMADEIAALEGETAETAATLKATAEAAVKAEGATEEEIAKAVADYKAAIDSLLNPVEDVTVTINAKTTAANSTLKLKNGEEDVTSYETTTEGGKLTVTATLTGEYKPYVILNGERNYFTASEDGKTWTLTFEVPEKTETLTVDAEAYYVVKLTVREAANALTINAPAKQEVMDSQKAAAELTFTVTTKNASQQPIVTGIPAPTATVKITEGEDANTWTVTVSKVTQSETIVLGVGTTSYLRVTKGTGSDKITFVSTELEAGQDIPVTGGTYTLVADVANGYQPNKGAETNGNWFSLAEDQTGVAEGYTRWEMEIPVSGPLASVTVNAKRLYVAYLTLKTGTYPEQVKIPEQYTKANTSDAYIIYVNDGSESQGTKALGYTAAIAGIKLEDGIVLSATSCTFAPDGDTWTLTYKTASAPIQNAAIEVEAKLAKTVTLSLPDGVKVVDGSTTRDANMSALKANGTTSVNYAEFIIKVPNNMMPTSVTPKAGTAPSVRYEPLENNQWKVIAVAGNDQNTTVTVTTAKIPVVTLTTDASGSVVIPAGPGKSYGPMTVAAAPLKSELPETATQAEQDAAWDWSGVSNMVYSVTFSGIETGELDAVVSGNTTPNAVAKPEKTNTTGIWNVLVSSNTYYESITVKLTAKDASANVTLVVDENTGKEITVDGDKFQIADDKGAVTYTVTVAEATENTVVRATCNLETATVQTVRNGDSWTITVSGLKKGETATVKISAEEAGNLFDWRVDPGQTTTGLVIINSPKSGEDCDGEFQFTVRLARGYAMKSNTITLAGTKAGSAVNDGFEADAANDEKQYKITYRLTDETTNTWTVSVVVRNAAQDGAAIVDNVVVSVGVSELIVVSDSNTGNAAQKTAPQAVDTFGTAADNITAVLLEQGDLPTGVVATYNATLSAMASGTAIDWYKNSEAEAVFYVAVKDGYALETVTNETLVTGITYSVAVNAAPSMTAAGNPTHTVYVVTVTIDTNAINENSDWATVVKADGAISAVNLKKDLTFVLNVIQAKNNAQA